VIAFGFTTLLALLSAAELPVEAPLPACAVPMDEPGRYHCARSLDETLDFYRRLFNQTGGVRWRNIISLPNIKARHIDSLRSKTRWEGINVYEKAGEVRIYVIARDEPKK
jgi:hypothetical protein